MQRKWKETKAQSTVRVELDPDSSESTSSNSGSVLKEYPAVHYSLSPCTSSHTFLICLSVSTDGWTTGNRTFVGGTVGYDL